MTHKDNNRINSDAIKALNAALNEIKSAEIRAAIRDLFAIGCYFELVDKHYVGYKCWLTALRALSLDDADMKLILGDIKGNEESYARAAWAHAEVLSLFKEPGITGD